MLIYRRVAMAITPRRYDINNPSNYMVVNLKVVVTDPACSSIAAEKRWMSTFQAAMPASKHGSARLMIGSHTLTRSQINAKNSGEVGSQVEGGEGGETLQEGQRGQAQEVHVCNPERRTCL